MNNIAGIAAIGIFLTGCASIPDDYEYELGDGMRHYCAATTPEARRAGRYLAARSGLTLVDLCSAASLIAGMEASGDT